LSAAAAALVVATPPLVAPSQKHPTRQTWPGQDDMANFDCKLL
jgi:hypothetical protein